MPLHWVASLHKPSSQPAQGRCTSQLWAMLEDAPLKAAREGDKAPGLSHAAHLGRYYITIISLALLPVVSEQSGRCKTSGQRRCRSLCTLNVAELFCIRVANSRFVGFRFSFSWAFCLLLCSGGIFF